MESKKIFSSRLLSLRKRKNISQKLLSTELGISDAAITMMEKGKRYPSFDMLFSLASYFEVPVDYLMGKTGTNLTRANLAKADMRDVKACGAIFVEANLSGADLRNADLRWADFSCANLQGARLHGAKLQGAIFTGANVSDTILEGKIINGEFCEQADDPTRH